MIAQDLEMPPGDCCQAGIVASAVSPPRNSSRYVFLRDEFRRFEHEGIAALFANDSVDALVFVFNWGFKEATIWSAEGGYPMVSRNDYPLGNIRALITHIGNCSAWTVS